MLLCQPLKCLTYIISFTLPIILMRKVVLQPFPLDNEGTEAERKLKCQSLTCVPLCDPMDCSPPGSSIHGIFQARVLEWAPVSFSRGPS